MPDDYEDRVTQARIAEALDAALEQVRAAEAAVLDAVLDAGAGREQGSHGAADG